MVCGCGLSSMSLESSDDEAELEESAALKDPVEGKGCGYSFFALSLRIEEGVVSMFPEVAMSYSRWCCLLLCFPNRLLWTPVAPTLIGLLLPSTKLVWRT